MEVSATPMKGIEKELDQNEGQNIKAEPTEEIVQSVKNPNLEGNDSKEVEESLRNKISQLE